MENDQKAATVKQDWKMPPAPVCGCGKEMQALAEFDGGEVFLEWHCEDCVNGNLMGVWPFLEDFATPQDLEALGFEVA